MGLIEGYKIKKNKVIISTEVGFNYRMSDLNCALGISQLSKISKFVKKGMIYLEDMRTI